MAFVSNRFVRQTIAYNAGQITTTFNPEVGAVIENGPAVFTYASADDSLATISAANYFSEVVYGLSINDRIDISGSDASGVYIVSAVDRELGTVSLVSYSTSGLIGTANILDGAVTTAKLNDDAVTSVKMAPTLLKYAVVNISDADFAFMFVSPILLLPAEGPNTLISVDKIELLMTFGTAAWQNGGNTYAQYDNTPMGAGEIASSSVSDSTFYDTESAVYAFQGSGVHKIFSESVNKGIYLSNTVAVFTSGDSNFVAHIWYKVIPTA